LEFNGGAGYDSFRALNDLAAGSWTYTKDVGSFTAARASAAYSKRFELPGVERIDQTGANQAAPAGAGPVGAAGGDQFIVRGAAPGSLTVFDGGGGADELEVTSYFLTLDTVEGQILFIGDGADNDIVGVFDFFDDTGDIAHLDQFTVGSHPGDTLFGPGGGLYFVGVSSLALGLGAGADTLYVQPNAVADVSVDAGDTPGDALYLALAAAVNPVVSEDGAGGGTVTSDDDRTLTFSAFDQLAGTDDIAPAAMSAEYLPDALEPALRVLFSEDLSPSLIPHSFVLRDDDTGEPVSPDAMRLAYDADTDSATLTFPGLPGERPADGNYTLTLLAGSAADLFGNVTAADFTFSFTVAVAPAPVLRSITINDGTPQRSQVKSLTLNFDQPVTLDAGATRLERLNTGGSGANDNSPPTDASAVLGTPTSPDGGLTWVYTFVGGNPFMQTSGGGSPTGSLVDGIYTISVDPAKVTAAGVPMATGGSLTFHRLFGDVNGSKDVNNADFGQFRNTFGKVVGDAGFNAAFDFDNSTVVNNADFGQFRGRFGKGFSYA
jgi:hypothetical protein